MPKVSWKIELDCHSGQILYRLARIKCPPGRPFACKQAKAYNSWMPVLTLVVFPGDEVGWATKNKSTFDIDFRPRTSPTKSVYYKSLRRKVRDTIRPISQYHSYKYTVRMNGIEDDPDLIVDPRRP